MRETDGSSARYWIGREHALSTTDVDLLTGAISTACELCATEAVLAVGSEHEGRVLDAITNKLRSFVDTAFDNAIAMALLPGLAFPDEDPHAAPKHNLDSPIAMLVHRYAEPYRQIAASDEDGQP